MAVPEVLSEPRQIFLRTFNGPSPRMITFHLSFSIFFVHAPRPTMNDQFVSCYTNYRYADPESGKMSPRNKCPPKSALRGAPPRKAIDSRCPTRDERRRPRGRPGSALEPLIARSRELERLGRLTTSRLHARLGSHRVHTGWRILGTCV